MRPLWRNAGRKGMAVVGAHELPNGCLQQIAAKRFSIPQDVIAILLQGMARRFWVPYGAAFSNLALPRILRNTTNISLKSLCDLATGFMDFLDNRISSLDHSLPTRHGYEKTSAPQHWQPVQSPNVKGHRAATSDSPLRFCQISPLRGTLLFVVF